MASNGSVGVGRQKDCQEVPEEDVKTVSCSSSVGDEVLRNTLISKIILSYLDARSVYKSRTVCQEWVDLTSKVMSPRKNIEFLCYAYDFTTRMNPLDVKPAAQLLHSRGLLGTNSAMMVEYLRDYLKNRMWSKPYFGLLFHGGIKTVPASIKTVVKNFLPVDCQLIGLASSSGFIPGLIDETTRHFSSTEIQGRGQLIAGMSFLLCPDMGFEVTPFDENTDFQEFTPKDGPHKKLKALLVFSTQYMKRVGRREQYISFDRVNEIFEEYDRKIALGGVIVDNIHVFPGTAKKLTTTSRMLSTPSFAKDFCGFAISGDNVKSASGIFHMESLESMEQELKDFRASLDFDPDIQSSKFKTFGMLFTCSGRGPVMFKDSLNAEVGLINRIFPFVVFSGIFGDGEFGENYWPKITNTENGIHVKSMEDEETKFWHFYSNVIVLIHVDVPETS